MRKEIAPELYNYNKFPGPEFHLSGDKVEAEGFALTQLKIARKPLMQRHLLNDFQKF